MIYGFYNFFFWLVFFLSIYNFFMNKFHLLCLLLSLEFFMLMVYILLCSLFSMYTSDYIIGLYYLTISVCDGGLGLSLLVMLIRSHSDELVLSMIMNI
uniref:NADH dehydrogenase subunit 4L n=1 Tax=Pallenopsis pilosa TaxID=1306352 RepID=UPI00226D19A7|nr:NADH dehydrogenase subunit 4L [Pallenopsis pilosa]UZA61335.1 NADH dehydrogenase subunit 4L [Pallenopsis pilosa]